jgi:hypothetical protein
VKILSFYKKNTLNCKTEENINEQPYQNEKLKSISSKKLIKKAQKSIITVKTEQNPS